MEILENSEFLSRKLLEKSWNFKVTPEKPWKLNLVPRLLLLRKDPGRSSSRDLLKSSRFLIDDDDDVDKYLYLKFITGILFCKFDLILKESKKVNGPIP
jgi:hypothetical protein